MPTKKETKAEEAKRLKAERERQAKEDLRAEKLLLGSLLMSSHTYFQIRHRVQANHFTLNAHSQIFRAIAEIAEGERKMTVSAVGVHMPQEIVVNDAGDEQETRDYLTALIDAAQRTEIGAIDVADIVSEKASRRILLHSLELGIKRVLTPDGKSIEDIMADVEAEISEIRGGATMAQPEHLFEIIKRELVNVEQAQAQEEPTGFTTGLVKLDNLLGPLYPGDLGFILAAQGDGKSALGMQVGVHVAETDPVLVVQMEMGPEQVAARELAAGSGVDLARIHKGDFNLGDRELIRAAAQRYENKKLWLLDTEELSLRQLEAHIIAMKRAYGVRVVIIDQLDKLKYEGPEKDFFRRGDAITGGLKKMAKRLKVCMIVLAQRTRTAQRGDSPVPRAGDADFRGVERDADWLLALWREANWLAQNRPMRNAAQNIIAKWAADYKKHKRTIHMIILKGRRSAPFTKDVFGWDGPRTRIYDDLIAEDGTMVAHQGGLDWD